MGILDFIYFSIGISTTSVFGDIMPNNKWLRSTISLQIIVSIVLVGLFVNALFEEIISGKV